MGIVDFLKGIFAEKPVAEEKPQEQVIPISKLEAWFAEKEAAIMRGTTLVMDNNKSRFIDAVKWCEQSRVALKSALPRYPQFYEQNKAVAEGNRTSFATAAENLLKSFKFPDSPNDFSEFIQNSNSALGEFMSSSNRSFIISNEFFTEQTGNIKKCLQDIDNVLQELVTHHKTQKLAEFPLVKEKIASLMQKTNQAKQLESDLKEIEVRLKDIHAQIEKTKQHSSEFLQSQLFLERQKLEIALKDARERTKTHEDEVHSIISVLDAPLRKLAWDNSAHRKLIELYSGDLADAILQDSSFKFGDVIAKLKSAIETGMVYAKDKRRSQALECTNRLTHTYLKEWLSQHCKLKNEESKLQEQIENSEANIKESELKSEMQTLEQELVALNENQASTIRAQKRIDLGEEVKEACSSLSALFGMQIKILKE